MREILFRGKRIDNGELVYGWLCRVGDKYANIVEKDTEVLYSVLTNTIGQYTGLTDKNGKKIFEGDIIKATDSTPEYSLAVIRAESYGYFIDYYFGGEKHDTEQIRGANWFLCDEVIGNIHDNPELLEVTE